MGTGTPDSQRFVDIPDLRVVLWHLWRGKWWIGAAGVLGAVLAAVLAFRMTPVYVASVVMLPADSGRSGVGGGSSRSAVGNLVALAGIDLSAANSTLKEALVVLRSRKFADDFIRDKSLVPVLFSSLWDAKSGRWKVPDREQPTPANAYSYFNNDIRTVIENEDAGAVTLQIFWTDRQAAADWANELVARLNAEMRRRAIADADASLGYLRRELETTPLIETRTAINRLIETQINKRMLANVNSEYAFRVVDPAVAPDDGDVVRPRKLVMIMIGAFLGLFAGTAAVALLWR
jgi:uncharacterized protein involved in exopolysaccharide biosynthesis